MFLEDFVKKVSKGAKIRKRYNQVTHLIQDTNGKVTNSQLDTTSESQEVSPFLAADHKAHINRPDREAQSVTCLATDACLTADSGVASSIPARSHTFVEIDHEIISTVILLPSAESFKKGCCQLQAKVCARITG